MSDTSVSTTTFTPSELVLLLGERFAGPGSMGKGKEELLTGAGTVATNDLGETVVLVALLALEQAGQIRLEPRTKKVLFGLMNRQTMVAVPTGRTQPWPAGTVEQRLLAAVGPAETTVSDMVYHILDSDVAWPRQQVLEEIKTGLAQRGLVAREEVKKLKIFTSYKFTLPEATREMLGSGSDEPAQALLRAAGQRDAEFMKLLRKQIDTGLDLRTESRSDSSDFSD